MLVHDAGGTILNKSEKNSTTLPIIISKCYTIIEKFNYIKGLKLYKKIELDKGEDDSWTSFSSIPDECRSII